MTCKQNASERDPRHQATTTAQAPEASIATLLRCYKKGHRNCSIDLWSGPECSLQSRTSKLCCCQGLPSTRVAFASSAPNRSAQCREEKVALQRRRTPRCISWILILHYLNDPDYGNYGIFLIMGNAGFISSTVGDVSDWCSARIDSTTNRAGVHQFFGVEGREPAGSRLEDVLRLADGSGASVTRVNEGISRSQTVRRIRDWKSVLGIGPSHDKRGHRGLTVLRELFLTAMPTSACRGSSGPSPPTYPRCRRPQLDSIDLATKRRRRGLTLRNISAQLCSAKGCPRIFSE